MTDEKYTAQELEEMANALLAQDKSADKAKSCLLYTSHQDLQQRHRG